MAALPSSPHPSTGTPTLVPQPQPAPRGKGTIYFFLILLIGAGIWYFRPEHEKESKRVVAPTVKAVRGTLSATRRVAGSIAASRFANVTAPILQAPDSGRGMTLTFLASGGTTVKKGDLLAEIDSQDARDHLDDVEAMVAQADLEIRKKKTMQISQMEELRQRLRAARAELLKAREEMKAVEVRSTISQELLKLSVEENQAAYTELSAEIPMMEERQRTDLNISMLGYEQVVRHRNRHRHDIERSRILSPIGGMVVLQTTNRNGEIKQIQVGELVNPGQPFMRVVDPKSMQLEGLMSQTDAETVRLGQPATIHFDAYPGIVLGGQVRSVGALAFSGRRTNYYNRRIPVQVSIANADSRVIPDLSASADVVVSGVAEGIIVPREAVSAASGKRVVYVRDGQGFDEREVEIAGESNTHLALSSGVKEGEEVALAPVSSIAP